MQILINFGGISLFQIACIERIKSLYSTFNSKLHRVSLYHWSELQNSEPNLNLQNPDSEFFSLCFHIPSLLLSNDKPKQCRNESDALYSRQSNHGLGSCSTYQEQSVLLKGFWDFWSLSHPDFPPGRIRTNELVELRTQNKRSSIQEQLTGDPGGQPKRQ